jgi:hypothetical protein
MWRFLFLVHSILPETSGKKWGKSFSRLLLVGMISVKLDIMKNRFIRIDASGSQEEIFERIINQLKI